ncbi:MAG: methionyl-tRNA formyltransferase [Candidatus Azotimanducaceae bacterium]|jgi:methionyl-tRNA formyltransferase
MRVLFAGTPSFAAQHLAGLLESNINIVGVITQPDKAGKRGKKTIPSEVKKIALSNGLPIIQPDKLTSKDLAPFSPDLLIVVAYGQILRQAVLDHPTYGCVNVHGSLLPRWRGAAPIQRAILEGDAETGICIIQMDRGLDTGDILAKRTISLNKTESSEDLIASLPPLGISALKEVMTQIEDKSLSPIVQTEEGMTYAHKIEKVDALCLWEKSFEEIDRMIRAFNPDPVCFTYLGTLRIKIYQAKIPAQGQQDSDSCPGTVLNISKKGILVACGDGEILIERVQLPLGKGSILSGSDVLNARSDIIYVGAIFSSSPEA